MRGRLWTGGNQSDGFQAVIWESVTFAAWLGLARRGTGRRAARWWSQRQRRTFPIDDMPAIGEHGTIAQGQAIGLGGHFRTRHLEGFGVLDSANSVIAFGPFRLLPAER